MNLVTPLALLMADRNRNSSRDTASVLLVSLMIQPPMLGLMLALAMSKQDAPAASSTGGRKLAASPPDSPPGGQGAVMLNRLVPRTSHPLSFFPSFKGLTKRHASDFARMLGLPEPTFVLQGNGTQEHVYEQTPKANVDWPPGGQVTLYLE